MNLKKLSNSRLQGYIQELDGLIDLALEDKVENAWEELQAKKDKAMDEFRFRTEQLGDFERLQPHRGRK